MLAIGCFPTHLLAEDFNTASIRTSVFGKEVHLDLVALSLADGGTSFHRASLLRNRTADYVAQKFISHRCSLNRTPEGCSWSLCFTVGDARHPLTMYRCLSRLAVILMKQSAERYIISWRGRCLLVAASNSRTCTTLEGGYSQGGLQEIDHSEDKFKQEKEYEDMTDTSPVSTRRRRISNSKRR